MSNSLPRQRCPVKECGAMVLLANVDGQSVSLNPVWVDVAVPSAGDSMTMVRGLQLHAATCVDISMRKASGSRLRV